MKLKTVNVYVCGICACEAQEVSHSSGSRRPRGWSAWLVQETELDMCALCTRDLARWRADRIYDAVQAKRQRQIDAVVARLEARP